MEGEFLRREPDVRFDQRRVEAHPARGRIDVGAGALQHGARLVVQEVDADLLQHLERGLMDRFEFVAGNEVERRKRRLRLPRRRRRDPAAALGRAPAAGAAAAPGILRRRFGGHFVPQSPAARGRAPRPRRSRSVACAVLAAPLIPASRQNGILPCQFAPGLLGGCYFAARSLGGSAGAGSGSGGRAVAPAENRAMSQERNNATASLLRSSG